MSVCNNSSVYTIGPTSSISRVEFFPLINASEFFTENMKTLNRISGLGFFHHMKGGICGSIFNDSFMTTVCIGMMTKVIAIAKIRNPKMMLTIEPTKKLGIRSCKPTVKIN